MVLLNFVLLLMVHLIFFYYQWYPYIIERLTTVTFINYSVQNHPKQLTFFLYFKLKNKRKRKKVNGFRRFWMKEVKKGYGCKTLNNTRVPLIIKKLRDTIDKVSNSRIPLIISFKDYLKYVLRQIKHPTWLYYVLYN